MTVRNYVTTKLKQIITIRIILLFILFCGYTSFGQKKQELDSLKNKLKQVTNLSEKAKINLRLSKILENKNRDSSSIFAKNAEKFALQLNDISLLNKSYLQQGILFYKQKKDTEALTYFNKIDSIYKINKKITPEYIRTKLYRSEISKFTFTMPGVLQAKQYILEALQLAKETNNTELIHLSELFLGKWHGFMSQAEHPEQHLDTANYYLYKVLPYYEKEKNYEYIAKVYYSLASVKASQKDIKGSEKFYLKRLEAIKKTTDSTKIGEAYFGLALVYRRYNLPDIGIKYLDSAYNLFKKHGFSADDRRKNLYKEYAYLYEQKKDYKNAFLNMQKALVYKDTLYEDTNNELARELEAKYLTKEKEQKLKLLEQQKRTQKNLYLALTGFLALTALFLFISYKNKQKVTKKLAELDKEKSNLFANISHEFRTPLTLIKTPVEQLLQNENLPIEQKSILTLVKRNADRLLDLVTQLLDISKIENNQLKLGVTPNNPKQFFNVLCDGFSYLAKQKQIIFLPYINCNLSDVWFDKDLVEKISTNILFNALKYTPEKGTVICNVYCENNLLNIEIKNTGKGLTKEEEAKIFERFYQADHLSPGIGLGLALVKELVTTHKGKINVTSIPNQWTTFLITLPVNKNSYKKSEIQEETNTTREPTLQIESSSPTEIQENKILEETENSQNSTSKKELPIMLLVDDNKDVRALLKHTFFPCYNILEASNGKEGIEKALEHIPDIIISDVMMPEIDGFKLCSTLKNDFKTSHIPIILLTAKAGQENLMEGTLCGADDYIVKPFNLDYLQAKVENLISSRKKLQQRYKQDAVLTPQDLAVTNLDQDFLQRIEDILKEQLTETSFNTEAFAKAACLSRMQLHRKLKALTGLSATEFIRSQRLKLAAHLLKQSDANVSEIGYQVGFSSPAYFSKLFKDAYGCSPSEYANRK